MIETKIFKKDHPPQSPVFPDNQSQFLLQNYLAKIGFYHDAEKHEYWNPAR